MDEQPPITITAEDIQEANRLSLHCPICADGVEKNVVEGAMIPVLCAQCQTLYHKACWERNGGKCAILGCGHTQYIVYGTLTEPLLRVTHADVAKEPLRPPTPPPLSKQLKEAEQQRAKEQRPSFWATLFQNLLRAIRGAR